MREIYGLEKHESLEEFLAKAEMRIDEGSLDEALTHMRKAVEYIIKQFVRENPECTGKDLFEQINNLQKEGIINKADTAMLHHIRKVGNTVGAHVTNEEITQEDAKKIFGNLIKFVPKFLEEIPYPSKKALADSKRISIDCDSIPPLKIGKHRESFAFYRECNDNYYFDEFDAYDVFDYLCESVPEEFLYEKIDGTSYINRSEYAKHLERAVNKILSAKKQLRSGGSVFIPGMLQEYFGFSRVYQDGITPVIVPVNEEDIKRDLAKYRELDEKLSMYSSKHVVDLREPQKQAEKTYVQKELTPEEKAFWEKYREERQARIEKELAEEKAKKEKELQEKIKKEKKEKTIVRIQLGTVAFVFLAIIAMLFIRGAKAKREELAAIEAAKNYANVICVDGVSLDQESINISGNAEKVELKIGHRYTTEEKKFVFEFNEEGAFSDFGLRLIKYIGNETEVVVPKEIQGYPVIEMDGWIFAGNNDVEKVVIEAAITEGGFRDCPALKEVVLPATVKSLGYLSYYNTPLLETITVDKSCVVHGSFAGDNMNPTVNYVVMQEGVGNDSQIVMESGNTYATKKGDFQFLFENNAITIIKYVGEETEAVVPKEIQGYPITSIYDTAFSNDFIKKVVIEAEVEECKFRDAVSLTEVVFPSTVKYLTHNTFVNTPNLITITISNDCAVDSTAIRNEVQPEIKYLN